MREIVRESEKWMKRKQTGKYVEFSHRLETEIKLWEGYSCGRNKSYERPAIRERKRVSTETLMKDKFDLLLFTHFILY